MEQVLNADPENARAYVGKLMLERKVRAENMLPTCQEPLDRSNQYNRAIRFADPSYRRELEGYNRKILDRLAREEQARREKGRRAREEAERERQAAELQREQEAQRKAEQERLAREAWEKNRKRRWITWGILLAAVASFILLNTFVIKPGKADRALKGLESQQALLEDHLAAGQYSDALQVSDRVRVKFGGYQWQVLDVQDGRALLITEEIIERRSYNRG